MYADPGRDNSFGLYRGNAASYAQTHRHHSGDTDSICSVLLIAAAAKATTRLQSEQGGTNSVVHVPYLCKCEVRDIS